MPQTEDQTTTEVTFISLEVTRKKKAAQNTAARMKDVQLCVSSKNVKVKIPLTNMLSFTGGGAPAGFDEKKEELLRAFFADNPTFNLVIKLGGKLGIGNNLAAEIRSAIGTYGGYSPIYHPPGTDLGARVQTPRRFCRVGIS